MNARMSLLLMLAVAVAVVGCAKKVEQPPAYEAVEEAVVEPAPVMAGAKLAGPEGSSVAGWVRFTEVEGGVRVEASVEGLQPGTHGFHLHETGDCSVDDFTSAGGHFNPMGTPHGAPVDAERHAGDLGNLVADAQGVATVDELSDILTVTESEMSVVGRAVIVHEKADDLVTQPTGAAGSRVACGVVTLDTGEYDEDTEEIIAVEEFDSDAL